jgi:hypothetical protein
MFFFYKKRKTIQNEAYKNALRNDLRTRKQIQLMLLFKKMLKKIRRTIRTKERQVKDKRIRTRRQGRKTRIRKGR